MSAAVLAMPGYETILAAFASNLLLTIRLYTNDPTLDPTRIAADFVEPVFAGYAGVGVSKWTPAALRGASAFTVADPVVYTFLGGAVPLPVRGYYATAGATGPLLWAWRRPDPAFQFSVASPLLTILIKLLFPAG